jgi:hypothetical protein
MSVNNKAIVPMPEGPSLDALLRRLLEMPPDFLLDFDTPVPGQTTPTPSRVNVTAVVHDVVALIFSNDGATHEAVSREGLERFEAALQNDNQRRAAGFAMVFAWLLADPWFPRHAGTRMSQKRVWYTFTTLAVAHGGEGTASQWHGDPKRREEIVRSMLATLELVPEGETEAQADDRLTRVSSAQRKRLLAAAREAEARAQVVREALAAKAAQEAADKYTRE